MRVNVHDFSGHPFQAQLSRNLAARGHEVLHGYSAQYVTGHGRLTRRAGDAGGLRFAPVTAEQPLVKYSPAGRARFELSYAQAWQRELDREDFDVVLACNVPLFALARMRHYFAHRGQPWVFWHQDIYSLGIAGEAQRRLPSRAARLVSTRAQRIERAQVRAANAVVAIGEPFLTQYRRWGVRTEHVQVIPNWAPLDDLRPGPRQNAWAAAQGLPGEPVRLLYAGTLGRKHNPLLLLDLLDAVRACGVDALLTVVSEGVGADLLAAAAAGRGDVRVLGYQPAEVFPDVLASADAVLALLEPDAAAFSVPSKVLSYLSAGRAVVALLPGGNPSAADVLAAGGVVADPSPAGARTAAAWLAEVARTPGGLAERGRRARALAEARFDIEEITTRFEQILGRACGAGRLRPGPAREPVSERAAVRARLAEGTSG